MVRNPPFTNAGATDSTKSIKRKFQIFSKERVESIKIYGFYLKRRGVIFCVYFSWM